MSLSHASDPNLVLANAGIFIALCPIFTGLRFYNRKVQKTNLAVDDWLTVPATVIVIGMAITLIIGVHRGVIAHATPKPDSDAFAYHYTVGEQVDWSFLLMHILCMGLIKLSFMFFYRRCFSIGKKKSFDIFTALMATIISIWTAAFFFWVLLVCGARVDDKWGPRAKQLAECSSYDQSVWAYAISDFVVDVIIFVIPIAMVSRLHMRLGRKLAILGIFSLGAAALAASTIRLAWTYLVTKAAEDNADIILTITQGLYWSMLESGLALIACCLPTLNLRRHQIDLKAVIRSTRSIWSLRSNSSGRDGKGSQPEVREGSSTPSNDNVTDLQIATDKTGIFAHRNGQCSTEINAETNDFRLRDSERGIPPSAGEIRVEQSVQQHSERT